MNRRRRIKRITRRRQRSRQIKRILFAVSVVVIVGVGACTKRAEYQRESARVSAETKVAEKVQDQAVKEKPLDEKEIRRLLAGEAFGKELRMLYNEDRRIGEIIRNRDSYPDVLIETLVKYPETLEYVLGYPERRQQKSAIDLSGELKKGSIPLFIQWDGRWGYQSYGDSMIGISGCGPTCLSMVVTGLTGDWQWNPARMAQYSEQNGYLVTGMGTSWELMGAGAEEFGLTVNRLPLSGEMISRELDNGHPVICSMKPGDFTYTGHFIVLTGMDKSGRVLLNDPNSRTRSERSWEMNRILEQLKSAWAYSVG